MILIFNMLVILPTCVDNLETKFSIIFIYLWR